MPSRRPPSNCQVLLTVDQRHAAEVFPVELQELEGVQHGFGDGAAPVERVEDRDAIRTAHHGLAVEGK
jgi:hypothetical protein